MLPVKQSKPDIQPIPEGFLLPESNSISTTKLIIGIVGNFVKVTIILALFIQAVRMTRIVQISGLSNSFVVRLFLVVLAAFILGILYNWSRSIYGAIDQVLVNLSFNPPELIFTNYPLSLGEEVSILFRRRRRSGKIIPTAGTVNATLTCNENVTYSDDDSYAFATEQIINYQLPEILIPAYESEIEIIFNIKIPPTAPPTFEAKNNQITWMLEVSVDLPKLLKETSKFHLHIQPRLIASNNHIK